MAAPDVVQWSYAVHLVDEFEQQLRSLHATGAVDGVAVLYAGGRNGPGAGYLRTSPVGPTAQWKAPGSAAYGPAVLIEAIGEYLLVDGETEGKWVRVKAWPLKIGSTAREARVLLSDAANNVLGGVNISAAQAAAGYADAIPLFIKTSGKATALDVRVWLDGTCSAFPYLGLSTDGVTIVTPDAEYHADTLVFPYLSTGDLELVYLHRTLAAGTLPQAELLSVVKCSWFGA